MDRVLETTVPLKDDPVARWLYLDAHPGPFGGHRGTSKTLQVVLRCGWWPGVDQQIELWVDRCWQCIQYRKATSKGIAQFIVPKAMMPWMHVLFDIEGPSTPKARSGAAYVFESFCALTRGVLYEPMVDLSHPRVRRAVSRCICRAGVLPQLLGHDRGPEIWNALMRELCAAGFSDLSRKPAQASGAGTH